MNESLRPKLIKTETGGLFKPGVFSGTNESGWEPIGDKVLILTDQPAEKSAGGIQFTDTLKERTALAAETGILAALGDGAWVWNSDRTRPFEGRRPRVGDYVYIQRYAGQVILGNDGQLYRLMDESCVAGVKFDHNLTEEEAVQETSKLLSKLKKNA